MNVLQTIIKRFKNEEINPRTDAEAEVKRLIVKYQIAIRDNKGAFDRILGKNSAIEHQLLGTIDTYQLVIADLKLLLRIKNLFTTKEVKEENGEEEK